MSGGMKIQVYTKYGTPAVGADAFVEGPASPPVTDNTFALWDGTTGRLIKGTTAGIDGSGHLDNVIVDLSWINVDAAAPNRFLTRDGSGNVVDTANPSLTNLAHDHSNAANGGTLPASSIPNLDGSKITTGFLPLARVPYARYEEQQAKNTGGGTPTGAAWNTRVLNTEVEDAEGIATLSSNVITLTNAGTYYIRAHAPAYQAGVHKLIFYNNTDSTVDLKGTSEFANTTDTTLTRATVQGRITIAASKAFTLRHYFATGSAAGLGVPTNVNDPNASALIEVYSVVEIWRLQ